MNILKRFLKDKKGSIAPLTALLFFPLFLAGGVAIDSALFYNSQSKIQNMADLAALAGIQEETPEEMIQVTRGFFEANQASEIIADMITDIDVNATVENGVKNIDLVVSGEQDTVFMSLSGNTSLGFQIEASSRVEEKKSEISVVLDVSYSMRNVKISRLRTAMYDFVDLLLDDSPSAEFLSMNIIPFGGNVNIGSDLLERFAPDFDDAIVDPSNSQYVSTITSGDQIAEAGYRFSTRGMNCIELKREDYDLSLMEDGSRSQIPRFINNRSRVTFCPEDESSILLNSSDATALKDKVENMVLSHGTAMDVGALWGLKALSPEFRGVVGGEHDERPADFDGTTQKVLIIMTDGNITRHSRPRYPADPRSLTNSRYMSNKKLINAGNVNSPAGSDTAIGRFKQICNEAKAKNINVFTIGFRIRPGTLADSLLRECVSTPENYYLVESLEIDSAFEAIAASIEDIRLSN